MHKAAPLPVHVDLQHGRGYQIAFGPLADFGAALDAALPGTGRVLVVSDENVAPLYSVALTEGLNRDAEHFVVPAGEASKSMEMLGRVHDWALSLGVDRRTTLVALGGGVVGDLAGFAAATLLRGLPFVQVPTSVIAQVDSATGGKTGVNHAAGKNLIGAFYQPALVYADPATLNTLPDRELLSGFAEMVKHALLAGGDLLDTVDKKWNALISRDPTVLPGVLREAVAVKAAVVAADELESGVRAHLNLGHTFGHAIERAAGYGTFTHGEAVAVGMRAALHLSASLRASQALPPATPLPAPFAAMDALVARLPAPALPSGLSTEALIGAMSHDKKRESGSARFVVLDGPGAPRIVSDIPDAFVEAAWCYVR